MTMFLLRCGTALMLGLLSISLSGCVSGAIATAITNAPNGGRTAVDPQRPSPVVYDVMGTVDVAGPPPATLAYWIMEPAPGQVTILSADAETPTPPDSPDFLEGWRGADTKPGKSQCFVRTQRGPVPPHPQPIATVILLHGWGSQVRSTDYLWHLSATLADTGCRVVIPDLRGHGDSTGEYVTSGFREVEDLATLLNQIDTLYPEDRDLPVGIVGHSYGGGIAIQFAAHDSRIKRVLALSPLADIRPSMLPGVRAIVRQTRPISWFFYLQLAINQNAIDEAQVKMQERTGADLSVYNAVAQIPRVDVPILILQGGKDIATPLAGAEALRDANPDAVELVLYPEASHTSYLRDEFSDVEARLRRWVEGLTDTSFP